MPPNPPRPGGEDGTPGPSRRRRRRGGESWGPFAHTPADPSHLVGNPLLLVAFGGTTERRLGPGAYLAVAGLGGAGGQLPWYGLTGETSWVWVLLGSSVVGRRLVFDLAVGVPAVCRFGHRSDDTTLHRAERTECGR